MNGEALTISVIVPAYNAAVTLPACLDALRCQTRVPDEVIIVDDGSTDDTAAIARGYGVTVIVQPNKGPAAARNHGVACATGRLVLFTDADCAPAPDWVACMSRPFAAPEIVGAKGTYRTRSGSLVARFVQQEYESKYARLARLPYIDFVDTYSAAYRRDAYLENGGFDEAFTVPSVEDQEFSFRLARKGYHIVFVPDAVVFHAQDQDVMEYARRKLGIGYWKAFMLRWLPEKALNDSHTAPEQRLQIGLLGLAVLSALAAIVWAPLAWIALVCLITLLAASTPLYAQIWRRDRPVVFCAAVMVLVRAAALGLGLFAGFLTTPLCPHHGTAGLSLLTRPAKRIMDLGGALIGGLLAFPVIAAAAIAIKLDGPGPVFFSQVRVGENGKVFCMHKLRTMVVGAEQQQSQLAHENHVKGPAFKHRHDPRVTRIGKVLRHWSIDELPQFWNVLRGEMSLVGPRPEEPAFVAQYDVHQRLRLVVKPGMTGPAQVAGRGELNFDQRLALELGYVTQYSLWRDLTILWKTVGAVIRGIGAY